MQRRGPPCIIRLDGWLTSDGKGRGDKRSLLRLLLVEDADEAFDQDSVEVLLE